MRIFLLVVIGLLLLSQTAYAGVSAPAPMTSAVTAALKRQSERALTANLITNPVYSGPATVTQASAVSGSTTKFFDPTTYANNMTVKHGITTGSTGNGIAIYSFQDLQGPELMGGIVEFWTDSPAVTFYVKRQSSTGFKLAINDQYVSAAPTTWSTADSTYNWLVISGLPSGQNKIRLEMNGSNPVFEGTYLTSLYSMWPTEVKILGVIVGDSYTYASGASYEINSWVNRFGILMGIDDLRPLGYPGTGYVASLNGTGFIAGTITNGANVVSVANTSGLSTGQPILANGDGDISSYFPRHTYITNVVTNTSITVSQNATGSGSSVSLFAPNAGVTPTDSFNGTIRLAFDFSKLPRTPDFIGNALGMNDDGNTPDYQATVQATFALERKLAPQALIVAFGVPSTPNNCNNSGSPNYISSCAQNNENVIASAVAAMNDPLIIYIPNSNAPVGGPGGSIFWGTGYQGHTNGTGNSDLYTWTDGTHPNDAGHLFYAQRFAELLRNALRALP